MIRVSEFVKDIKPYVPGKPVDELKRELGLKRVIKLASNENPLGPPKRVINGMKRFMREINRYPDGSGYYLKDVISKIHGVSHEEIILGNGSNEIIDIAVKTFLMPGDEAVMAKPSFIVYRMATKMQGANPLEIPLRDYRHDLMGMRDAINHKTRMVFIANPNNPTGTINNKMEFHRFIEDIPQDVLVVVDEAYYEYVDTDDYPDTLSYLRNGKNLLILRTFSKIYGLAGLRIGYGISKPDIIREMNKVREPFNTSTVAQLSAVEALRDRRHLKISLKVNNEGKRFLYDGFQRLGIKYVPSHANFVYLNLPYPAETVFRELLRKGVIVRPMGDNYLRVTIGLMEENRIFLRALRDVFEKINLKKGGL